MRDFISASILKCSEPEGKLSSSTFIPLASYGRRKFHTRASSLVSQRLSRGIVAGLGIEIRCPSYLHQLCLGILISKCRWARSNGRVIRYARCGVWPCAIKSSAFFCLPKFAIQGRAMTARFSNPRSHCARYIHRYRVGG